MFCLEWGVDFFCKNCNYKYNNIPERFFIPKKDECCIKCKSNSGFIERSYKKTIFGKIIFRD